MIKRVVSILSSLFGSKKYCHGLLEDNNCETNIREDNHTFRMLLPGISILLAAWIVLNLINSCIRIYRPDADIPALFPISVFYGPTVHLAGIPWSVLFGTILMIVMSKISSLGLVKIWCATVLLVICGNMSQGSFERAFLRPVNGNEVQYYSEAIRIDDANAFVSHFNIDQAQLNDHSRTHPPFAILIQYYLLRLYSSPVLVSLFFSIVSSGIVVILWKIFTALKVHSDKRSALCLLCSVMPAYNIYSVVSLDGIIAFCFTFALWGLILILNGSRFWYGATLCILGCVIAHALTFASVFLLAVIFVTAIKEVVCYGRLSVLLLLVYVLAVLAVCHLCLYLYYDYNHIGAFVTASHLENPHGFRLCANPLAYLWTRIEGVCEIVLFMSLGWVAFMMLPYNMVNVVKRWSTVSVFCAMTGITVLMGMFASGAYKTGETARACMFIYPYMLLMMIDVPLKSLKVIIYMAAFQSIVMQLCGDYFW